MALVIGDIAFIHIYKNGGNAVRKAIPTGKEIASPHINYQQLKELTGRDYRSFAFVRHPYTHNLSLYNYIKIGKGHDKHEYCNNHSFEQWLHYLSDTLLNEPYVNNKDLYRLQCDFVNHDTEIFKFENFDNEMHRVFKMYNFPIMPLNKINVHGNKERYDLLLTDEAKEIINKTYDRDFRAFGYFKEW